jgi:hypothetical protein
MVIAIFIEILYFMVLRIFIDIDFEAIYVKFTVKEVLLSLYDTQVVEIFLFNQWWVVHQRKSHDLECHI